MSVATTRTGGCGCGGGSVAPSGTGGCGCGGSCGGCGGSCGEARTPAGGFVRPRFFAGQVLLDEDLAAVDRYVSGKNRLHNRFLHGAGVVCGLDVSCHPCGGGTVLVGSGYALDCCGNDLVVPCDEQIDVLGLVREQRTAANGGYDCGPCVPSGPEPATGPAVSGTSDEPPEPRPRRYWLGLRYTERLTDPVEPYATDAACAPAVCEPSRVREGYRFVLTEGPVAPDDVVTRVLACLGPQRRMRRVLEAGRRVRGFGERLTAALDPKQDVRSPRPEDFARPALGRLRNLAAGPAPGPVDRQLVDDLTSAAGLVVRARMLSDADRKAEGLTTAQIDDAAAVVSAAAAAISAAAPDEAGDDPGQPFAAAAARAAERAAALRPGDAAPELALLARGVAADAELFVDAAQLLRDQQAWLLERAERDGMTDCDFATAVVRVRIPSATQGEAGGQITETDGTALDAAARELGRLTDRWVISCVCRALNPPCGDCPDDAVLLAGIDVLDCEITSICQVPRRIVVSGPAVEYWLGLGRIREFLTGICCADAEPDLRKLVDELVSPIRQVAGVVRDSLGLSAEPERPQPKVMAMTPPPAAAVVAAPSPAPPADARVETLERALRDGLAELAEVRTALDELRSSLASPAGPAAPVAKKAAAKSAARTASRTTTETTAKKTAAKKTT